MLRLAGEKMSKSLGNIVSLRKALDEWGRETLLVYFLTAHWRKPMDLSDEVLEQAAAIAETLREVFRNPSQPAGEGEWDRFVEALEDDFNTADALAVMHAWRDHELLARALAVFGLESLAEQEAAPPEVVELAERRQQARAARDFDEADRLRTEIETAGWEARDVADGFRLVRSRRV
jgi:cysteinyl-tRNA synthetase